MVRPVFWAWLFLGVKDELAAHYGDGGSARAPLDLQWQIAHVRKRSVLLAEKDGVPESPVRE